MQAARLAEAAQQLYALPPGSFRQARDERAAQARTAGDRELATAIGRLRRPTVTAWLVNQLVREAGDQVEELLDLGARLREAQSALAGPAMRELSGRRRELVSALTRSAQRLARKAGQAVSEHTEREVRATLEAALADPAAAGAVRAGQLTTALSYAGLGGTGAGAVVTAGDLAGGEPPGRAGAGPEAPVRGAKAAGRGAMAAGRHAQVAEAARRDLAEAEAAVREAGDALARAEEETAATAGRHDAARGRIEELESELGEARAAEGHAARAATEARRSRDSATRALVTARRRLTRARERAARAAPPGSTG